MFNRVGRERENNNNNNNVEYGKRDMNQMQREKGSI